MNNEEILDTELSTQLTRRKLLPVWIKVFLWIFLITGVIAPLGFIFGLMGVQFELALYGLETNNPLSVIGILLTVLFTFKGIVSYGLWTEKDWAVQLAILDGIIGIIVCAFVMVVLPLLPKDGPVLISIRLELIALIPYLIKMNKIKGYWAQRKTINQG